MVQSILPWAAGWNGIQNVQQPEHDPSKQKGCLLNCWSTVKIEPYSSDADFPVAEKWRSQEHSSLLMQWALFEVGGWTRRISFFSSHFEAVQHFHTHKVISVCARQVPWMVQYRCPVYHYKLLKSDTMKWSSRLSFVDWRPCTGHGRREWERTMSGCC